MDSFSNWLHVETVRHCDTKNTILFLSRWFSQYGVPLQLISDNGFQFKSTLCIKHIWTAAHHQSSNGHAERYV